MNERVPETSNPAFELPSSTEGSERHFERAVEGLQPGDSSAPKLAQSTTQVPDPQPTLTATSPVIVQATTDDNVSTAGSDIQTNKNTDRIEKHWVERAKSVIAQTKDNPFDQKRQISQVKADYLKKRFNKLVKTEETTG